MGFHLEYNANACAFLIPIDKNSINLNKNCDAIRRMNEIIRFQ